jgi:uncharacterized protein YbaP (TraB family)
MNFRKYLYLILLISIGLFPSTSYSKSSVWKVSKDDNYFYLGGTVHILNASDHPLPKEFFHAYENSDKLIFETNISESKTPEAQQKFLYAMLFKSGRTLSDDLNPKTFQDLKSFLTSRQIPIANFAQFRPWAVALTISVLEYQRIGMVPEYGVEEYFNKQAALDNKQLGHLESLDEQISFISSMESIDPNLLINYTLRDLETLSELSNFLNNSWRTGDIEAFTTHSLIVQMKAEFPDLYNTLITNRNTNWMSDILTLNSNELIEFVLVGTLHLNGEDGLLNQLKIAGYEITQLSE